ncbi:TPA: hypothetical protein ACXND4_005814, partial [Burkholderia multivorans]
MGRLGGRRRFVRRRLRGGFAVEARFGLIDHCAFLVTLATTAATAAAAATALFAVARAGFGIRC